MQFAFNDEQQMLRDSAERFGAEEWNAAERLKRLAEVGEGAAQRWGKMAELGWLMLPIAEEDGGLGGGPVEVMAIMEAVGRHLMTDAYVSHCVLPAALLAGGGEHCAALLEQVGAGQVRIAAALIEDEGFDIAAISTTADEEFRLTGTKAHVEDGADADCYLLSARTAGTSSVRGGDARLCARAPAVRRRDRQLPGRPAQGGRHERRVRGSARADDGRGVATRGRGRREVAHRGSQGPRRAMRYRGGAAGGAAPRRGGGERGTDRQPSFAPPDDARPGAWGS